MELLTPGMWHHHVQWPQTFAEVSQWQECKQQGNWWSLQLTTYNITFKWILGAWNKPADCLYWLLRVPNTLATTSILIILVVTSTPERPATWICSKTKTLMDTMPLLMFPHNDNKIPLRQMHPSLSWKTTKKFTTNAENRSILQMYLQMVVQWQSTLPWNWHFHQHQQSPFQTCHGCHMEISGASHLQIMVFHGTHQSTW